MGAPSLKSDKGEDEKSSLPLSPLLIWGAMDAVLSSTPSTRFESMSTACNKSSSPSPRRSLLLSCSSLLPCSLLPHCSVLLPCSL